MSLLTISEVRKRYDLECRISENSTFSLESLNEAQILDSTRKYDIFLSHSSSDNKIILGTVLKLQDCGYSVYVDINDKSLNPNIVTKRTAEILKQRMQNCESFVYAFSTHSPSSKWMPWELGYFDGLRGKVAVLPIVSEPRASYVGTEYIGLYRQIQFGVEDNQYPYLYFQNGRYTMLFHDWLHTDFTTFTII